MEYLDRERVSDGQIHENSKQCELPYLRRKCRLLGLEESYKVYLGRLNFTRTSLLIFIYILLSCLHIVLIISLGSQLDRVHFDLLIYLGCMVVITILLLINFNQNFLFKRPNWVFFLNILAVAVMIAKDVIVTLHYHMDDIKQMEYTFNHISIILIYYYFPFHKYKEHIAVGLAATCVYLFDLRYFLQENNDTYALLKAKDNLLFYLGLNIIGIFFRLSREYAVRVSILNRQHLLEEHLLFKGVMKREKEMLNTILPPNIAQSMSENVKERIETARRYGHVPYVQRTMFIEPHTNVSILFADVVNYTSLTTKLEIKRLMELLHELFVRFDKAAEINKVLPVKFLGDCYVCCTGVPLPNEAHAKCCVNLGLEMIEILKLLRNKHNSDINMRIGVHSGDVMSGVIGCTKWHFDIWSKDVDIANRMEQTGIVDYVHVSENTLNLLENEYVYKDFTRSAHRDEVLQRYNIHSFLVSRLKTKPRKTVVKVPALFPVSLQGDKRDSIESEETLRSQTILEMTSEADKMPIGRIQIARFFDFSHREERENSEDYIFETNVTPFWLLFYNTNEEFRFLKQTDYMFKYSTVIAVVVSLIILGIVAPSQSFTDHYIVYVIAIITSLLLSLVVTYKKIWLICVAKSVWSRPTCFCSLWIFKLSDFLNRNLVGRITIYLSFVIILTTMSTLQLANCNVGEAELGIIEAQLADIEDHNICFAPTKLTATMVLVVIVCFLFSNIPYAIKLIISIFTVFVFWILSIFSYQLIFLQYTNYNMGFSSDYASFWYVLAMLLTLWIIERHIVYIAKVDYTAKRRMLIKREQSAIKNKTIKIVLNNILPPHVADKFFDKSLGTELYAEKYDKVAILFASIENYDPEIIGIRVLNEVICYFDDILEKYGGKIEKIKVAGWTYMAVCGLETNRPPADTSITLPFSQQPNKNSLVRFNVDSNIDQHSLWPAKQSFYIEDSDEVVLILALFALDLLRIIRDINQHNILVNWLSESQGALRIGMSHGPIVAGVIGISKPHYDVWGHAVNMAARMYTTGNQGSIHVTENTASILRGYDIRCDYCGLTTIKGIGLLPTYTVAVDDKLNFIRNAVVTNEKSSLPTEPGSSQSA